MMKCSVAITRKRSAGSNSVAADRSGARTARLMSRSAVRRHTRDMSEKSEVGDGRNLDAGERPLPHRDVGLVPQTDVRRLLRNRFLHLSVQLPPSILVGGDGGFVEQAIDGGILEEAPVESGGRHLRGMEDPAQDVGI